MWWRDLLAMAAAPVPGESWLGLQVRVEARSSQEGIRGTEVVANVTGALRPLQGVVKVLIVVAALLATLLTTSFAAPRARAATSAPQLKAVLIVGPSGLTSTNKADADAVAAKAAGYGMDVHKVYTPHATWAAVLAQVQGANFVVYWGHGNGWPSPYGPFQEKTKDGWG